VKHRRGVALVLVLLITAVLSLLALQFNLEARDRVGKATFLVNRAEAELRLHSREAAMLHTLLTHNWITAADSAAERREPPANPYVAAWNFRGEPFSVDGATFRIQDVSGLQPLPQPRLPDDDFPRLLSAIGIDPTRANEAARRLRGFLGPPQYPPLQAFGDLEPIAGLTPAEIARLEAVSTLYPTTNFNPGTAPNEVISIRFGGSILQGVQNLRAQGQLNTDSLRRLMNDTGDFTSFYPGPAFRVATKVSFRGVTLHREVTLVLKPYGREPVTLWAHRRLDGME